MSKLSGLGRWLFVVLLSPLFLAGCEDVASKTPGAIPIKLVGLDRETCPYQLSIEGKRWELDYFAFYLSFPEVRIDGKWQPLKFVENQWQTPDIAMVSYHNGCSNKSQANNQIILNASKALMGLATNLRFTLGVPFEINHTHPADLPSPLNIPEMFVSAREGHRYLRLDLRDTTNPDKLWQYHLGSAECSSVGEDSAPNRSCGFTNRVNFILPMSQLDSVLELDASITNLVSQVNLDISEGCIMSSPELPVCDRLMQNLVNRPWLVWD